MSLRPQINNEQTFRSNCRFPNMADDKIRLNSFRTWRGCQGLNIRSLVENGFFCTEQGYSVQCYICGVSIETWTVEMDPFLEHVRWAPYCKLLPELQQSALLAEIKDQIFGVDKMRVPSGIPLDRNNDVFTGHRVENTESSSKGPPTATVPNGHGERHSESSGTSQEQAPFISHAAAGEELDGDFTTNLKNPGQRNFRGEDIIKLIFAQEE